MVHCQKDGTKKMDISTATLVYNNPKGHSKEELHECLRILFEASQPIELNELQFLAIQDALNRLGTNDRRIQ